MDIKSKWYENVMGILDGRYKRTRMPEYTFTYYLLITVFLFIISQVLWIVSFF